MLNQTAAHADGQVAPAHDVSMRIHDREVTSVTDHLWMTCGRQFARLGELTNSALESAKTDPVQCATCSFFCAEGMTVGRCTSASSSWWRMGSSLVGDQQRECRYYRLQSLVVAMQHFSEVRHGT